MLLFIQLVCIKTFHFAPTPTRFKIPVRLLRSSKDVCAIGAQSKQAAVFRDIRLIVWDEISMTNRQDLEAVDRCLRDVRKQEIPFGGVVLVCAGDFRQLLPVVQKGTRANSIMAWVSRSRLWNLFKRHRLTKNLRLLSNSDPVAYHRYTNLLMQVSLYLRVNFVMVNRVCLLDTINHFDNSFRLDLVH